MSDVIKTHLSFPKLLQPVSHVEGNKCLANMPKVLVMVMIEMMILNGGDSSGMCE